MYEIDVPPRSTDGLRGVLEPDDHARLEAALGELRDAVGAGRMWHVNSTARGGGVAEMLSSLLPYAAGAGDRVRWLVVEGDDEFFTVTKRLHNRLHGADGDGGPLGAAERGAYERLLGVEAEALRTLVAPGDVVVLHDPQTAGLAPRLDGHGAGMVWRSHIGVDVPSDRARSAWAFLRDDVLVAPLLVFTRSSYVWDLLPPERVAIVAPCIDVLSPKNQPMDEATCAAILRASGLLDGHDGVRHDDHDDHDRHNGDGDGGGPGGSSGPGTAAEPAYWAGGQRHLVRRRTSLVEDQPVPPGARLVVQVARWDRLKDPAGLVSAFAEHVAVPDAHLVVAGPSLDGVTDDPEGLSVFDEVQRRWHDLDPAARARVHLACIPMDDLDENAAIVNALQRRADVVVQKSRAEGFGLTVAEAMWKRRPVVASRVGGMQDQIVHGRSGVLVDDPDDLPAFGQAITDLLTDEGRSRALGAAGHERVCECFLPLHHFAAEAALVTRLRDAP